MGPQQAAFTSAGLLLAGFQLVCRPKVFSCACLCGQPRSLRPSLVTENRFTYRKCRCPRWVAPLIIPIAASMLIYLSGSGSSTEATFGVRGATPGNEGPSQWRENRQNVPSLYSSTSSMRTVAGAPTAGFQGTCWAVSMATLPLAPSSKNRTAQLQKNPASH
jgi:hypothetical protein